MSGKHEKSKEIERDKRQICVCVSVLAVGRLSNKERKRKETTQKNGNLKGKKGEREKRTF